jgi:hypothetical protein
MKARGKTPTIASGSDFRSGISRGQGPTLATIQMVTAAIKEAKEYPSKYQLWRSLPKGMAYGKLEEVLTYLESTNQIMIDKDGEIIWILADNPKLKKLLAETKPF